MTFEVTKGPTRLRGHVLHQRTVERVRFFTIEPRGQVGEAVAVLERR